MKYRNKQLVIFDSIRLKDEPYFLDLEFSLLSKLKGPQGFVAGKNGGGQVFVFDGEGQLKFYFDKTAVNHFEFPEGVPVGYEYSPNDSSLYIVFPYEHKVLKVNQKGDLVSTVSLEIPREYEFTSQPHLFISESNEIAVSIGYKNYKRSVEFYQESPLFGMFDSNGRFIRVLGTYPESLKEPNLARLSSKVPSLYHAVRTQEGILIGHNHSPEISLFNWQGQLLNTWQLKSPTMDYLDQTESQLSPGPNAGIDMIFSLALSENEQQLHKVFSTQSWGRKFDRIPNNFLFSVDLTDSSASEINLTNAFPNSQIIRLLPWTRRDTLMFIIQNRDVESLYLYKAKLKDK